jgi:hypothetical protein
MCDRFETERLKLVSGINNGCPVIFVEQKTACVQHVKFVTEMHSDKILFVIIAGAP